MTHREAQIAKRIAKENAEIAASQATKRKLEAEQHAIDRRRYQRRLRTVGKLVDAVGLLDWPDDVLEKALRRIADQGIPGTQTEEG